jgi:xanthine/uracil permease
MVGCLIAGALIAATSYFTNWRAQIVADLPESISKAAKAAIGALLVKKAFDLFTEGTTKSHLDFKLGVVFVSIGVGIIILFFLLRNKLGHPEKSHHHLLNFLLRIEFLVVVLLITFLLYIYQHDYITSLAAKTEFTFLWQDPYVSQSWNWNFVNVILTSVFAGVIWFIVMSDIPGTPSEVLPEACKEYEAGRAVRRGFLNDGIFALLSPIFGITPTIYYAENQILRDFNTYSKNVGLWTISIFGILFLGILISQIFELATFSLERLIPPVAVIPILLFIGLYIIAVSFLKAPSDSEVSATRTIQYYLPSAIAVILTPRIGLEYAYPLAILSYWLVRSDVDIHGRTFEWVSVGAGISLFIFMIVFLFGPP